MASTSTIRPLPADVASQIKSSVGITSPNGVVIELLKNSLDACARKIEIGIDYGRGACTVEDDGLGIPPNEFKEGGGLGKLHYTSKYNSDILCYGRNGSFIASLATLSLLSITSHHHLHNSHNTISINRSRVIARHIPAPPLHHISAFKHGTRVTVRDLFGNMPVRIKQRATGSAGQPGSWRELEELRKGLTGILLAWTTSVIVTVKDGASSQKIQLRGSKMLRGFDTEVGFLTHVCSTLSYAEFISSAEKPSWISIHASTRELSILGAVSLEPAPTKTVQFISFGINPLFSQDGHNILYEDINRLFRNSYFGSEGIIDINERRENRGPNDRRWQSDGFTNRELKIARRGLDRHPMFVIKIQASGRDSSYSSNDVNDLMNDKHGTLSSVTELLHAVILEFLRVHKFQPRTTRPLFNPNGRYPQSVENSSDSDPSLTIEQTSEFISSTPSSHETVRLGKGCGSGAESPNARLASAHPERTESLFDSWSRIKRGKRVHSTKGSTGTDCSMRTSQQVSATIVKSGKVVRQPFGDLPLPVSVSLGGIDGSVEDGIAAWINPVTKEKFLVNSRTGFVVPPIKLDKQSAYQQSFHVEDAQCQAPLVNEASSQEKGHLASNRSSWIDEILRNWDNPVFHPTEPGIPQISVDGICGDSGTQCEQKRKFTQLEIGGVLRELSRGLSGRISKEALSRAEIVSQVDNKFVLTKIQGNITATESCDTVGSKEMLVIVDQHAADERCRIEELLKKLCTGVQDHKSHPEVPLVVPEVRATSLEKPLCLNISHRETQLLRTYMPHFARWGILYDLPHPGENTGPRQHQNIVVKSLPSGIVERCKVDPKLVIDLVRSEAWKCAENEPRHGDWPRSVTIQDIGTGEREHEAKHNWVRIVHDCPQGILDLLNSRACRSAVMFNDELSTDQCKTLISRLADCAFPFQCAHGRPSMVPLMDLDLLDHQRSSDVDGNFQKSESFGRAFKKWRCKIPSISGI